MESETFYIRIDLVLSKNSNFFSSVKLPSHGTWSHVNNERVGACLQVAQPTKQRGLVTSSNAHIYVIKVNDGCDHVDACLFLAKVRIVFVGELAYLRYEIVYETCLVLALCLLEFVEQECVKISSCCELLSKIFWFERFQIVSIVYISLAILLRRFAVTWIN